MALADKAYSPRAVRQLPAILSAGIMLDWLGRRHDDKNAVAAGSLIERAVDQALLDIAGRTPDLGGDASTQQAGDAVVRALETLAQEA